MVGLLPPRGMDFIHAFSFSPAHSLVTAATVSK
jgi:hypothetical protein